MKIKLFKSNGDLPPKKRLKLYNIIIVVRSVLMRATNIFPHSDCIWRDTEYLSAYSPNAGKCRPE